MQQSGLRSMTSNHKPMVVLRCKLIVVGDACVGKSAITQVFQSGGSTYPKNYLMVSQSVKHTRVGTSIFLFYFKKSLRYLTLRLYLAQWTLLQYN